MPGPTYGRATPRLRSAPAITILIAALNHPDCRCTLPGHPATSTTAGLFLPWCNTEGMGLHLAEIAARVSPRKHCALLVE